MSHLSDAIFSVNATNRNNSSNDFISISNNTTMMTTTLTKVKISKALAFGAFSNTRINHFLPPAVGRALVAAGLLVIESF